MEVSDAIGLVLEPKHIFESQFHLLIFSEAGLKTCSIYTSRDQELQQLQGIRFAVTLALETRMPLHRVESNLHVLGQGVVYVLTQVIGRGLGLVARGILQGAGNTWQEVARGRNPSLQRVTEDSE